MRTLPLTAVLACCAIAAAPRRGEGANPYQQLQVTPPTSVVEITDQDHELAPPAYTALPEIGFTDATTVISDSSINHNIDSSDVYAPELAFPVEFSMEQEWSLPAIPGEQLLPSRRTTSPPRRCYGRMEYIGWWEAKNTANQLWGEVLSTDGYHPGGRFLFGAWMKDHPYLAVEIENHGQQGFFSGHLRLRAALLKNEFHSAMGRGNWRIDLLGGGSAWYFSERFNFLTQGTVGTDLARLGRGFPSYLNAASFDFVDAIQPKNSFVGMDLGWVWSWETEKWSLELRTKVALGTTREKVTFHREVTNPDAKYKYVPSAEGGVLQLNNSSEEVYRRNIFGLVPEVGITCGYRFTPRWRGTVGYTLVYWDDIARPGAYYDHLIDASSSPFQWHDTYLLVHGLSAGLECRY